MYISELKLHGFKSFAKKEVMKLGQGVTTVVGPNGCGKTNIVDAIRWVLGEQKYSILRSGKMEDVIFNGAENIKPLGVCEVSLTVHNNSGKLPVEYNDIEIARRVYRSGESEYFLNRTPCRLKDINDLFIDTGMGADAYSVIELKMIEQILSDTGDDRRRMFEEAAGINKYRHQRKRTLKRFEATRVDLERINDIIAEVEQKVRTLELQLKRFKRHETLSQNLEENDLKLAYLQVFRYRSIITPLNKKIKEFKHLRESRSSKSSTYEMKLNKFRDTYHLQEAELQKLQIALKELNENREKIRNNILVWNEKGRGAMLTVDRLNRESQNNHKKIASISQLSLDFDKEISEIEPSINTLLEQYKKEKNILKKLDYDYRQAVENLEKGQDSRWELQRKQNEDRTLFERTKALVNEKSIHLLEFENILNVNHKNKLLHKKEIQSLDKESKKIKRKLTTVNDLLGNYEKELKLLRNQEIELLEELRLVKGKLQILDGELSFYKDLVETREGFPEGTRYILENPKEFSGVLGTIADMFQIKPDFRDALETGLGDLSHCLIAKDRNSAMSIIDKAREMKIGSLTIIPLKEAANLKIKLKAIPRIENIIGRASDMVNTSIELKPLAEYLLGNLLVVKSLKEASSDSMTNWGVVDLTGSYSGNNLVLKNRQVSVHGNVMGRQKKLDSIEAEIKIYLKNENKLSSNLVRSTKAVSRKKKLVEVTLRNIEELKDRLNILDSESYRIRINNEQLLKNEANTKSEIKVVKEVLKESKDALHSLGPKIDKAEKVYQEAEKDVELANQIMVRARENRDNYQQKLQDSRIKLVELESRRDQVKFKKSSGSESEKELRSRQIIISKEIDELKQKHSDLQTQIQTGEKDLNSFNAEIQKQRSILDLKQLAYRDTYQSIEEIQVKIAAEQRDREQILLDLKNVELEVAESVQKIRLVEERIDNRYGKTISENLIVDSTEEELDLQIEKIQRSLDNIGPINMAVKDEFEEENERLSTLNTQRNDLTSSEENLRETIRKIDRVARKRFQETFDLIKSNFEELFHLFFEGGEATLTFIGDLDPLEADISIMAQPPGKRNTSLRLLSSGEKALTAISLLFAIYQVKPSPYCILDEVDAPLDDVNIRKFTRVLSKFSDETQFIIVTHNKLTMEIADYMYGVTQQKKGLSQLVSVKFD
ncbi:MAG: chromosome segregation protein SMC [Candidatus Marinimicrobia bacterium]|nr:chromosome segregation protein SMC [Candidatus Neomarinimicrobiota bacterium]